MSGPIKRIKGDDEPLPRPLPWIIRAIYAVAEFGGELLEALILGLRAGLWCAFVIFGFGAAFFGIAVALYAAGVWILSRFPA